LLALFEGVCYQIGVGQCQKEDIQYCFQIVKYLFDAVSEEGDFNLDFPTVESEIIHEFYGKPSA
jgi:hypothetical protein